MIKVVQNPKEEIPFEVLATSIKDISNAVKKMRSTKISDRAILVLMKDLTGLPMVDIRKVIDGLESLEKVYLKKPIKK